MSEKLNNNQGNNDESSPWDALMQDGVMLKNHTPDAEEATIESPGATPPPVIIDPTSSSRPVIEPSPSEHLSEMPTLPPIITEPPIMTAPPEFFNPEDNR